MNNAVAVLICLLALAISFTVMVRAGRKSWWLSGLAQNASESTHPNLWDGLVGFWVPDGRVLRDISGNKNHGTLMNMERKDEQN